MQLYEIKDLGERGARGARYPIFTWGSFGVFPIAIDYWRRPSLLHARALRYEVYTGALCFAVADLTTIGPQVLAASVNYKDALFLRGFRMDATCERGKENYRGKRRNFHRSTREVVPVQWQGSLRSSDQISEAGSRTVTAISTSSLLISENRPVRTYFQAQHRLRR